MKYRLSTAPNNMVQIEKMNKYIRASNISSTKGVHLQKITILMNLINTLKDESS